MLLVLTNVDDSSIEGKGLFAAEYIKKGTRIWEFREECDQIFRPEEVEAMEEQKQSRIRKFSYICRTGLYVFMGDDGAYFNHADKPNTKTITTEDGSGDYTIALRDIRKGEELTSDYREFDHSAEFGRAEDVLYVLNTPKADEEKTSET